MSGFFSHLLNGQRVGPAAVINGAGVGPLPSVPSYAPPGLHGPDTRINSFSTLLSNKLGPYSWGPNKERIETQTQNAIPNKVQLVIPRLFIPAAQCVGGMMHDPVLEHTTNEGDLVFSLRMNYEMQAQGPQYCILPYSKAYRCLKLVNLATVNYLLWGLQVGSNLPDGRDRMWRTFFQHFCKGAQEPYEGGRYTMEVVWNFLRTYIAPYGVQHGSDKQGGQHEGSERRIVTQSNDYVSAFAVEGKLLRVANLWRACDIKQNDDVVLEMAYLPPQAERIPFNLCCSSRAIRMEVAPVPMGFWYLRPSVLAYRTIVAKPHIHIGRSRVDVDNYTSNQAALDLPHWNARGCAPGAVLEMTFEPGFVSSDAMLLRQVTKGLMPGMTPGMPTQREMDRLHQPVDAQGGGGGGGGDVGGRAAPADPRALMQPPAPLAMHAMRRAAPGQAMIDDRAPAAQPRADDRADSAFAQLMDPAAARPAAPAPKKQKTKHRESAEMPLDPPAL